MAQLETANYDALLGVDQTALNALAASFFKAAPSLFTQTFTVGQAGITTISVQFAVAPTVVLTPQAKYLDEAHQLFAPHVSGDELGKAIKQLLAGTMTATCQTVNVTVNGTTPVTVVASVTCGAAVSVDQGASSTQALRIVLADATFTVAGEQVLSTLLTTYAAPLLVAYLNGAILDHIQIPMLALAGVTFVTPVITDEVAGSDTYLTAYTGLNGVSAPSPGNVWPTKCLFVGVDASALNAVVSHLLPSPSGTGGTSTPNLSWDYNVNFSGSTVQINPTAGNELTVNLNLGGGADITFHTPNGLPNISFGATFSGSANASANLVISQDGSNEDFSIIIQSVGGIDLHISINGLPGFFSWLLGPVTSLLADAIAPIVSSILSHYPIHVYTLSPISLHFGGVSMKVALSNLQLWQGTGADGLPLIFVSANPELTPSAAIVFKKSFTQAAGNFGTTIKAALR